MLLSPEDFHLIDKVWEASLALSDVVMSQLGKRPRGRVSALFPPALFRFRTPKGVVSSATLQGASHKHTSTVHSIYQVSLIRAEKESEIPLLSPGSWFLSSWVHLAMGKCHLFCLPCLLFIWSSSEPSYSLLRLLVFLLVPFEIYIGEYGHRCWNTEEKCYIQNLYIGFLI